MANNYFSNHSTSRFLANSAATTQSNNAMNNSSATTTPSAPNATTAPRSRLPSSKHFSTSVGSIERSKSKDSLKVSASSASAAAEVHPLRNTWVFWFRQQRSPGNKIIDYEEGIKKIAAFSSVESFWSLWTHLAPPSALQPTTDYLLFHSGIRRPVWEDPLNLTGGKWIIRLRKGVADRLWEDLVLAIIGDMFDDCRSQPQAGLNGGANASGKNSGQDGNESNTNDFPEICGCTISVRQSEDIVSLWNRVEADIKVRERIRDTLRKVLNLPPSTIMEYKSNNDSMQDKSSFRNSAIDRTPLS